MEGFGWEESLGPSPLSHVPLGTPSLPAPSLPRGKFGAVCTCTEKATGLKLAAKVIKKNTPKDKVVGAGYTEGEGIFGVGTSPLPPSVSLHQMDRLTALPQGPDVPNHEPDTSVNLPWGLPFPDTGYSCPLFGLTQQMLMSAGSGPGPVLGTGGPEVKQMWSPPSGSTRINRCGLELCL